VRGLGSLLAILLLVSCGGGGGGGGGSGSGGDFTIGSTTANFRAIQGAQAPGQLQIAVTVTGSDVAAVGAGFPVGNQPTWLNVNLVGAGNNLTLTLQVTDTTLSPAQYQATVIVGTADSGGNVLRTRQVAVTYDLLTAILAVPTSNAANFTFGSSVTSQTIGLGVTAPGKTWTIASDQPWLTVPAGAQTGSQNLTLTVDVAGQLIGGGAAVVTIQNTGEPLDRRLVTLTYTINAPSPIVTPGAVGIGSPNGIDGLIQPVEISLDTGTSSYPWTLTLSDSQNLGWMTATASNGSISGNQNGTLALSFDPTRVAPGKHTGQARFDVTVLGQTFSTTVPVNLDWESHRLVPSADGVAFSSFPTRQKLTRTLTVSSSRLRNGIAWSAQSDQSWLAVTAAGVTGGTLDLTANPTGLAAGLHIANVTLHSPLFGIERDEHIRVGLWVGAADPANVDLAIATGPLAMAANPVEPLAYASAGSLIHVYNVHDGAEIGTFDLQASGASDLFELETSSDGRFLFAADRPTARVLTLDAVTGALVDTYQAQSFGTPVAQMAYVRTNGIPVLWTPFDDTRTDIISVETGAQMPLRRDGSPLFQSFESTRGASADGQFMYTMSGGSTSTQLHIFSTSISALDEGGLQIVEQNGAFVPGGGFGAQICGREGSSHVYVLASFAAYELDHAQFLRELPIPANTSGGAVSCGFDGLTYLGLTTLGNPQDNLLIFSPGSAGTPAVSGPMDAVRPLRMMHLAGDGLRVVSTQVILGPSFLISFYNLP
jgi:hypothetical protein